MSFDYQLDTLNWNFAMPIPTTIRFPILSSGYLGNLGEDLPNRKEIQNRTQFRVAKVELRIQ